MNNDSQPKTTFQLAHPVVAQGLAPLPREVGLYSLHGGFSVIWRKPVEIEVCGHLWPSPSQTRMPAENHRLSFQLLLLLWSLNSWGRG